MPDLIEIVRADANQGIWTENPASFVDGHVVLAKMNAVGVGEPSDVGPIVHDFIQISGFYFEDYLKEVAKRGYDGFDYVPHDAKVPSFETGRTRIETMIGFKRKPKLVADHYVDDGIIDQLKHMLEHLGEGEHQILISLYKAYLAKEDVQGALDTLNTAIKNLQASQH